MMLEERDEKVSNSNPHNHAGQFIRLRNKFVTVILHRIPYTGEGIADILSYLKEERDTLPWEEVKSKYDELGFGAGEDAKDQNRFHNI